MEDKSNTSEEHTGNQDAILDLNFVPQWARKPPGENHYDSADFDQRDDRRRERRGRPGGGRPAGGRDRRRDSGPRSGPPRGPRPDRGERTPRPPRERRTYEPVQQLPVTVSFLPEQKRLASLVRQIHHARRAYPLIDLASIFLQDPEGCLVKIEAERSDKEFVLFQCRHCRQVTASRDLMVQHLLSTHLEDVYEKEDIETEPPAGQFVCVARCRKTGILLGPPNHHSYSDKLNELHQTRFSHLTIDDYKRNIETVRDEELINQWKEESRKKTVYKRKDDPEAEAVELGKAEAAFRKELDGMYEETRRAVVPSSIARQTEDRNVKHAIRQIWQKESRFPLTLSFAMRAAFRHMHLYLFKAGKINFVTHIKPHAIRPEDTVENIGEVLRFLQEHPGSTRKHMIGLLRPEAAMDSPEAAEVLQPLGWLIERGHIIEFFNGTLSVPLTRRR